MELYKKQKILGLILILLGLILFFLLMSYFNLFGSKITPNITSFLKMLTAFFFPLEISAFGVGYTFLGIQGGLKVAKWFFVILSLAYILGFLRHIILVLISN